MAKKLPIRVTLDPDILDWLKAESKLKRKSMSHIIRDLLWIEMVDGGDDKKK